MVRRFIQRILGFLNLNRCEHCGRRWCGAERRRQMTAYQQEECNWAVLCDSCQTYRDECWSEMWNDWRGLL
jgi:hypothetical protein